MSIRFLLVAVLVCGCGCGSSPSQRNWPNPNPAPLSFSPKQTVHEGELSRDPSLRADLTRQQLISYLESTPGQTLDTGGVGQDLLPFYCSQPMQLRMSGDAPHLAEARILDHEGKVVAAWRQGAQEVSLPVGDYQLELTSNLRADAHIFLRTWPPADIRPLTTTPGVYVAEISETPQAILIVPQTALIGASSDGTSQVGSFANEADFQYNVHNPGANLSLAVHQYFANGGTNLEVVTSTGTTPADLNSALAKLPENISFQLALPDLYQLPADQADALAETALAWAVGQNSLVFLDIPDSVNTAPLTVAWRQQRPQLASSQCLLYWPGLNLGDNQQVGSSSSVLGLLDSLGQQSGPGTPPLGQALQGAQSPQVLYSLAEISDLGSAQINPIYPDLTIAPGALLVPQPSIPDLSSQQKLLTITQTIRTFMQSYVFSPNNANTWQLLTQGVSATMLALYQQGVLAGSNPAQAFQFECGVPLTMTGTDILNGYLILSGRVLLAPAIPPTVLTFRQTMQDP